MNWIIGASVAGLAAITIVGIFEYASGGTEDSLSDHVIIFAMVILVSVLIGAAIVFEAIRHFDPRKDDLDDLPSREENVDRPSSE